MTEPQIQSIQKAVALWTVSMASDNLVDSKAFMALLKDYVNEGPSSAIEVLLGFLNLTTVLLANIEAITDQDMREHLSQLIVSLEERSID